MRLSLITVTRSRKGLPVRAARTIEGESFELGRATSCPIYLPDPRVALLHATIFVDRGAIRLATVGTATMMVNGRPDAEATLAPGVHVEIGPYALDVETAPSGVDLVLSVELVRPLPDDLAEIRARSRTSLEMTRLAKRAPAWALLLIVLAAFLAIPVINAVLPPLRAATAKMPIAPDRSWNPGPLAAGHQAFAQDCAKCHELPFVRVRDRTCVGCHQKVAGHVAAAAAEERLFGSVRCATCHADHKGANGLVRIDSGLCTDCHADLKRRAPDTKLGNAADFAKAHPEFKVTLWTGPGKDDVVRVVETDKTNLVERSHLRFPHDEHLRQSIRSPKGRVSLECRSCHVPDASGKAFEPINMQKHCVLCHTLEFEPAVTSRQVPHGSVDDAMVTMQEFYASIALNNVPVDVIDTGEIRRDVPRPAGATLTEAERQRALAWARAKARKVAQDLFEARVCIVCHEIARKAGPGGGADILWSVAPVHIATTWLPKASFDHERHRTYKCSDCHDKVARSTKSSDVNIPDIETCRVCHAGNVRAAKREVSTCEACHGFHLPGHAPMQKVAGPDARHLARAAAGVSGPAAAP